MGFSRLSLEELALFQEPLVAERLSSHSLFPSFPTLIVLFMLDVVNVVMRWRKCCVISLN